jgi:hypothetical protein
VNPRYLTIGLIAAAVLVGVSVLTVAPASARRADVVLNAGPGTATIDGVMTPGEWDNAATRTFPVSVAGGGAVQATLFVMNDKSTLYVAFKIARPTLGTTHVGVWFDNNDNGSSGEDGISFWTNDPRGFSDEFRCGSSWCLDSARDGRSDGQARASNDGAESVYELSHPLASGDSGHDFSLSPGSEEGFDALVQVEGSGGGEGCLPVCNILDPSSFGQLFLSKTAPPPIGPTGDHGPRPKQHAVSKAVFAAHWHESVATGALVVSGRSTRTATLTVVLRRGNSVVWTRPLHIPARAFRVLLAPLPTGLIPGSYRLTVKPGVGFAQQQLAVSLPAPPEGVVDTAYVSRFKSGPALTALPSGANQIWAFFHFASRPQGPRALTVTWYGPDYQESVGKPNQPIIQSTVQLGGHGLRSGTWRAVLRAGGTIVKQVSARIG